MWVVCLRVVRSVPNGVVVRVPEQMLQLEVAVVQQEPIDGGRVVQLREEVRAQGTDVAEYPVVVAVPASSCGVVKQGKCGCVEVVVETQLLLLYLEMDVVS